MKPIQNYFIQITIQKGHLLANEDGSFEKVVNETIKDDLYLLESEAEAGKFSKKLIDNGNLDFEEVQKEINLKK